VKAPFGLTLAALVTALAWIFGDGMSGLLTLALYLIGVAPGVLLGRTLFGRNAIAIAAGALLGYALLAFAFWIPIAAGRPGRLSFVCAWLALGLICYAVAQWRGGDAPLVPLPTWTPRDRAALLLFLHLVPLLVGAPYARAGERDDAGTRYYRAYFTADFIWHMALANELARFEPELRNPYIATESLHYYWTYFLPATVIGTRGTPHALTHVEGALKVSALMASLLLATMIYAAAWVATGRRWAALAAASLAVLAPSFEGLYVLHDLWSRGIPWQALRDLNVDAVSNWPQYPFHGLRIDGLQRTMWWTPQHGTSCALGLIAIVAASRGVAATLGGTIAIGVALGLSLTFNPLLGAVSCAVFGVTVLVDLLARRLTFAGLLRQAITIVPVGLGLWWCFAAGMSDGADAVTLGLHRYAREAPFKALFISLGGVLIPAAAALLPSRHVPFRPAVPALLTVIAAIILMHFVTITESSWVGFRAGNLILVTVGMLVARALVATEHRSSRTLALSFAGVLFLAGLPTTAIDWFNARDLENRRMGPGFLWVVPYRAEQQAGFAWVRQATPPHAIVQFDPIVRARQNWSDIPTFTGRRMIAAEPISLLPQPHYRTLSERVHAIYTSLPPDEAHAEARALGINYLWIDGEDLAAPTGPALERLTARPDLFPVFFEQGETRVLAIAR